MKPKLLLHTCCATCAIYVIEQLVQKFEVTVYFYGPNIHPRQEYNQRREEIKKYTKKIGLNFQEGEYDTALWFKKTKGLEQEPEKGRRCSVCFGLRLSSTAQKAQAEGYDAFASTLSISPHKDNKMISLIGSHLAEVFRLTFLDKDWKKQDGFKIANQLSQEENFYRQNYCGCVYSKRNK
ncbi:MAG: hypothetical protein COV55_02465 [Candidatus Komeilibacteria bacterium CG11_big_fil_rev_8_21_14_0_20_36_20]|uniref:Epoxyqueuosine reductase QueH n=1 Tax=Candidatus Komeilibacteria bacterium CG11_big_fil_rev_8_21_14_0_20_36_20 TaxID=1974477 RepID=A0A2H0ND39_9BACT|nr:MAG: hypothetical protein COV55_02465 [Candidatus Komeilibacteria bacterium CG11_big_fil_rev_8_21_14_0_20_36_20]PIR81837.1 MAG: hypothetical protein COU21_01525 [Candidatus Komeilibacteria bacterium CG10_big_fil_rev_8_21_14_0_10_36_65]PJC55328.1 MAG: hypothetical protein CO027_02865 [Candidatus Komeilibacteria bacterium CG_4_9_14_0_2_um_filter_36_13]